MGLTHGHVKLSSGLNMLLDDFMTIASSTQKNYPRNYSSYGGNYYSKIEGQTISVVKLNFNPYQRLDLQLDPQFLLVQQFHLRPHQKLLPRHQLQEHRLARLQNPSQLR